jgi:hypothetical protein
VAWTTNASGIEYVCVGDGAGDVVGGTEVHAADDDTETGDVFSDAWQPARKSASRAADPARAFISSA